MQYGLPLGPAVFVFPEPVTLDDATSHQMSEELERGPLSEKLLPVSTPVPATAAAPRRAWSSSPG